MLTFTKTFEDPLPHAFASYGCHGEYLFYDIETTGLSPKTAHIYLIGCLYSDGQTSCLTQWFAENKQDERKVLEAFSDCLRKRSPDCLLVQYNGNGFDFPFLRTRYENQNLPFLLPNFDSLDIYREVLPYKKVLGLTSLKQKNLEDYLKIERKDPYTGGELISVYDAYTKHPSKEGLETLLLHNLEDVQNMTKLLAFLQIREYLQADYLLESVTPHHAKKLDGTAKTELLLSFSSPVPLPQPITIRLESGIYLIARSSAIRVSVPLKKQTLKYFFPNEKEYFYLPAEDRAIHKSVGFFVDPSHRTKATKDTCYIKKEGWFLPCPPKMDEFSPILPYRENRKDSSYWISWSEEEGIDTLPSSDFWVAYVHKIFQISDRCK